MFDQAGFSEDDSVLSALDGADLSLRSAAAIDFKGTDGQLLCDAAVRLERLRRFLDATQCQVLAELDARGETDRVFGLKTSQWLARQALLPSGVTKARVGVAKKLATALPDVGKALSRGDIGFDHAKVLADAANPRIVDMMAAASAQLCAEAKEMFFHPWRNRVQSVADLLDQDGGHDPDADLARNRLRLSPTGDNVALKGELVGENAQIAAEVLNSIADELFRKYARDNEISPELEIPSRATLMALALVEACRRGLAAPLGSTKAPRPEAAFILTPNDNHSACCSHGDNRDAACSGHGSGRFGGFFDGGASSALRDFGGMTVADRNGNLLSQRSWRMLLCDPDMYALVVNSLGVPLDLGHKIRFANQQQRRALAARDGGCVFPGCTSPSSWTDAHHMVHWEHGGSTDVDNLVSLCRHHHGVAHRRGWNLRLDDEGWSIWTSPNGQIFEGQRHHQQRHSHGPAG